jgi:hypothetical protein
MRVSKVQLAQQYYITAMQQLPNLLAKQPTVWGASPIGAGLQPCRDG